MIKYLLPLVCLSLALPMSEAVKGKGAGTMEDRQKLRKALFEDYDIMNLPENVTLKFAMALVRLDAYPEQNIVETIGWLRYVWTDPRLAWDESQTSVGVLRAGSDEVWKPDFVLYNSESLQEMVPCGKSNVLIYPSGEVLWVPPCTHRALCDLNGLKENPMKTMECELKFGSWTLDGYSMDLQFYGNQTAPDMADFNDLSDWKVVSSSGERISKTYDCCEEPYLSINYKFQIQKKNYFGKCAA